MNGAAGCSGSGKEDGDDADIGEEQGPQDVAARDDTDSETASLSDEATVDFDDDDFEAML